MRILLAAIYPYAFLLLFLIIPFDNYIRALPNILLIIVLVSFPFIVKKEDVAKLKTRPVLLFLLFFLYLVVNALLAGRIETDWNLIKKVLISVGLVILYIPINDIEKVNKAIIFSSLAAIIFTIYNFVLITDRYGNFAFGESPQLIESLLIDRLYLGFLSVLSIFISFNSIQKKFHPSTNYYISNILINFIFILFIGSKIALVALVIMLLVRQLYSKKKKWLRLGILAGVLAVVIAGVYRVNETSSTANTAAAGNKAGLLRSSMTMDLRFVVWKCAETISENYGFTLSGMGFSEIQEHLQDCYRANIPNPEKKLQFSSNRYNTHNQYVDFYLGAGFIGISLFLLFLIQLVVEHRKKFYPTALACIFIMYCFIENVFHRQIGAYYMGLILILLLTNSYSKKEEVIKIDSQD